MEKVVRSVIKFDKTKCNVTSIFQGKESLKDLLVNIAQDEIKSTSLSVIDTDNAAGLLYACKSHRISFDTIYNVVFEDLKRNAILSAAD